MSQKLQSVALLPAVVAVIALAAVVFMGPAVSPIIINDYENLQTD